MSGTWLSARRCILLYNWRKSRCATPSTALTQRYGTEAWYDTATARLPNWQQLRISKARQNLIDREKPVTPGRVVAELSFGFWTGFFNKIHARSGLGYYLAKQTFPHAPRTERDMVKLDARWKRIRDLRNRVFHHERIVHFTDLDAQHAAILEVVGWISPELHDLSRALDRFARLRQGGLQPWLDQIYTRWPQPSAP